MHEDVYRDCLQCEYHKVMCAIDLSLKEPPRTIYGRKLVIDNKLKEDEWLVQTPRLYHR